MASKKTAKHGSNKLPILLWIVCVVLLLAAVIPGLGLPPRNQPIFAPGINILTLSGLVFVLVFVIMALLIGRLSKN